MALKPGLVFEVMACAWRHDVLDKFMSVLGDAIDLVMRDTGLMIGDLVNKLDEAEEATIVKLNALIARSGFALRVMANDRVMAAVSRMLDAGPVRKAAVSMLRRMLVRALTAPEPGVKTAGARAPRVMEGGRT